MTSISHGSRSPFPAASWRNLISNLGPNSGLSIELIWETLKYGESFYRISFNYKYAKEIFLILKNYIIGALNTSFSFFPEKIFDFTALLTALKSLSTKLLIEAR